MKVEIAVGWYAFMSLLSRKVDYGLLILSYLHHRSDGGCARAVAQQYGLSRAFVANILKELCHKGFVVSQRGIKGGYVLRRAAEDITLAELMDALDDSFRLAECCSPVPGEDCWLFGSCPIQGPVAEVHRRIREMLGNVRLVELMGSGPANVTLEVSRCRPVQVG
jgi:Rrf2 family cysteine metabolism transcriptional repressor